MKDKKLFLVWHDNGWPGTWLLWFINQHNNFPKFKGRYLYSPVPGPSESTKFEFEMPLHYSCDGVSWHIKTKMPTDRNFLPSILRGKFNADDSINLKQHQKHFMTDYDKSFTSVALKLSAQHNPGKARTWQINSDIAKECKVYKNIMMIAGDYEWLIGRRMYDLTLEDNPKSRRQKLKSSYVKMIDVKNVTKNFPYIGENAPNYIINIGRLLNEVEGEYLNLVRALETEPREDWKKLIKSGTVMFQKYLKEK
jgi:hypothetical protein